MSINQLTRSAHSQEKRVSHWLPQYPRDSAHVCDGIQKQDQLHWSRRVAVVLSQIMIKRFGQLLHISYVCVESGIARRISEVTIKQNALPKHFFRVDLEISFNFTSKKRVEPISVGSIDEPILEDPAAFVIPQPQDVVDGLAKRGVESNDFRGGA